MKKLLLFLFPVVLCFYAFPQQRPVPKRFGPLLWKFKTNGRIFSSPLLYRGLVFVGSGDHVLYALHAESGRSAWKFRTDGAIDGSPAAGKGQVFFTSYDGYFYCLDAGTGRLRWKFRTRGEKKVGAKGLWTMQPANQYMEDPFDFFLSAPAVDTVNAVVYFGSGDGNCYALDTRDGKLRWKFPTGGIIHTSPVLHDETLYFGSWDRFLYALDRRTGKEKWKFRTNADTAQHLLEGIQASPVIYNRQVYFGSRDGFFYALDEASGRLNWKFAANNSWILTTAAAGDSTVYIGTSDTYLLLALDAATGKLRFQSPASGYVYSSPVIKGSTLYFGDFTGQLLAADRHTGALLDKFETPGRQNNAALLNAGKLDFAFVTKGLDIAKYSTTVTGMDRLYTLGPILSTPAVGMSSIFFGSADGYCYALRLLE